MRKCLEHYDVMKSKIEILMRKLRFLTSRQDWKSVHVIQPKSMQRMAKEE